MEGGQLEGKNEIKDVFSFCHKLGKHDGIFASSFLSNKSSTPIRHGPAFLKPSSLGCHNSSYQIICHFQMSMNDHPTTHPPLTSLHLLLLMDDKDDILRRCKPHTHSDEFHLRQREHENTTAKPSACIPSTKNFVCCRPRN